MIRAHCGKEKKTIAKMPGGYCRISLLVLLPLFFISFGVERTTNSRFGVRIVRKTKVKKIKAVNEDEFYDAMSAQDGMSDEVDYNGKRGTSSVGRKRGKKLFGRNKIAPAPESPEAWMKTSGKAPRAANKYISQETCYTSKEVIVEEDGKMKMKRSTQKWDTKTGKEIKLDKNDTDESSSSVAPDPSSFLNVLKPFTTDNFNMCNPDGSPRDLSRHVDEDVPGPSGIRVTNEMVLDLTDGNAWEETEKRTEEKSMWSSFLSLFTRSGPKTTKVHKLRL